MIDDTPVREAFCEIGRRCWQRQFVASNDGNFSFRLSRDRVLCTPTLISKGFMRPADMVVTDLDGNKVAGGRELTSEIRIHLYIYQQRPDIHAVVHVHPPHATAFAVANRALPKAILPEIEFHSGEIPIAPYSRQGTWEFARSIAPWVLDHDCFLLANHGAITLGRDPYDAYYRMETLDQYCRILLLAGQAGGWSPLGRQEMDELLALKASAGVPDRRNRAAGDPCDPDTPPGPPRPPRDLSLFTPQETPPEDAPKAGASHWPTQISAGDLHASISEVLRRLAT